MCFKLSDCEGSKSWNIKCRIKTMFVQNTVVIVNLTHKDNVKRLSTGTNAYSLCNLTNSFIGHGLQNTDG